MGSSIDNQINQVLEGVKFASIEELNSLVREGGLPQDFIQTATDSALNSRIRRIISRRVGPDGLKDFESIERQTQDGDTERIYVQLSLLNKDEYRQVADQYVERANYMCAKANTIVVRGNKQHKTKRQLPFPGFGLLNDGEAETA